MSKLTDWFLDNPVAANLLMVLVLAAGLLSLDTLRVESFPTPPPSRLTVSVTYPGATAQQVEEGITQRIEDALSGLPGIARITSESSQSYAQVTVRKQPDIDLDRLLDDVRNRVNSIVGFPSQAEQAQVKRSEFNSLASFVMIYGDLNNDQLQQAAIRVERALKRHPQISQVTNLGKQSQQLVIEPDPEQLRRYGLTLDSISEAVSLWSLEYRSGSLKSAAGTLTLRADGYRDDMPNLRALPLISRQGAQVTLADVADISRGYQNSDSRVRYQQLPAISLLISTSQKDNLLDVSDAVQQVLAEVKSQLPAGAQLDVMADMAPYIKNQLGLLSTNAWQGLLIVLVLLGLFLELRLAFWVALGIPISMAGALWLMGLSSLNYSINDITLFGMILVLGILVDDAVVVGESIHAARQHHSCPKKAAREGVNKVAVATVFGVLTTIAAFSPMLWIENELAKVLAGFSAIVIMALIFSLIESKFILPSHLCLPVSRPSRSLISRAFKRVQHICNSSLERFSYRYYQPLLRSALNNRLAVLALFISAMLLAIGMMQQGVVRTLFFPEIPGRYLTAKVEMEQGVPLSLTHLNAQQLERALEQTNQQLQRTYQLDSAPVARSLVYAEGADEIELTAELSEEALAKLTPTKVLNHWQQQAGTLEGAYSVKFSASDAIGGGTFITVSALDRQQARLLAADVKEALAKLAGVQEVYDDSQLGGTEIQLTLNERGQQLGLNQQQLARIVGGGFGDIELHRLLRNGEETKVLLRFGDSQRSNKEQLLATPIPLSNSQSVSLGEVATLSYKQQPQQLYRRNRDDVISVYWRQDRNVQAPEAVWQQLQQQTVKDLEARYPGSKVAAAGEFDEISEVRSGFKKAMILTLLLIYALLAIPLKSYWQPFIIMSVIPFGFAGAVFGHALMDLPVSVLSMFGMMAMTGVVINDSLVLMTRFNQLYHEQGMTVKAALLEAGRSRLRAIFLTTVTTVCGLLPLLSETSEQAQYLKPAAVSLVFGELFATPITLLLIPVLLAFGCYKKPEVSVASSNAVVGVGEVVK